MRDRPGQIGAYWLSKRPGSNAWHRTWFDAGRRQTLRASLGTDDLEEAKIALTDWFVRNVRAPETKPQETPFELVLVRYYNQHASTLASAEMARIAMAKLSDGFPGALVNELTPAAQDDFIAKLRAAGLSDGYIRRIMSVAAAALEWSRRRGELTAYPMITLPNDSPPRDRVLTMDESLALWLCAEHWHERMFLALAFCTLARPEAILGLRREYADLENRRLAQNPPGRRQTKKYRPTVPIVAALVPWLQAAPAGPLVSWRGKHIASFKTAFRAMRARAGLGLDVVPKTIRHTMATELRRASVPEAEISGMLGHRAYGGVTEVYAKYRPDYLGLAARAIDDYMKRLRSSCVAVAKRVKREIA